MPLRSPCEDRFQEIQDLLGQGKTRKEIAQALGLTKHTVQAFLQRRKIGGVPRELRLKRLPDDEMISLLDSGLTQAETAARLGFSVSAIERRVAKLDLGTARTGPRAGAGHRQKWAGGKTTDPYGYWMIWVPLHPYCKHEAYVTEHRLVMEVLLDRYLEPQEVVHHIDGCKWHNWPSNLQLFPGNAIHRRVGHTREANAIRAQLRSDAEQNKTWIAHCSTPDDTLAQCPEEIRATLEQYIARHRPTIAHRSLPRRAFLRSGAIDLAEDQDLRSNPDTGCLPSIGGL